MARVSPFHLLLLVSLSLTMSGSASVAPISDLHRSAALDLFVSKDGSFGSLEVTYQALRMFRILNIDGDVDIDIYQSTCPLVVDTLGSSSSSLKDLFYALKVHGFLGCKVDATQLQAVASKLQQGAGNADSLWDMYYSIGGLLLLKEQGSDVVLTDADGKFHAIKALSQSDGRWRYNTKSPEANAHAAGIALETLAGVLSLSNEVDQSTVGVVKNDIVKLFDSAKSYDDGTLYFDDEHADADKYQGPILTTTSVVRGLTLFSAVTTGKIHVEGDKILGLAKFFLTIGVPGSPTDLFNQIESLSCLNYNRISIPLILSLPATVLSLSSKDLLKVKVTTVFGTAAPSLTVSLKQAFTHDSKRKLVLENQELKHDDADSSSHTLDIPSLNLDVGKYLLDFEITLHDPDHNNIYTTGRGAQSTLFVTGYVNIKDAEISVRDADSGSADSKKSLDLAGANTVALSANHLQKLQLSFQLTTPLGNFFRPQQVFLKLVHESKVEHIFMIGGSEKFSIELVFLGLVGKLYYLSGKYELQLFVGDSVMENSFSRILGHLELDLPEPPEKATRPPAQPVDPYLRFAPRAEISHIFNAPEKRPREELSLAFLVLTLLPLLVFVIGLTQLGVNVKNFPTSTVPATFSFLFHAGIAAVLALYTLFWLKLDLFITLKVLGILGGFLIFVGHGALSHIASLSSKLKSS